jgi:preprotein translocase subunit SecA
MSERAELRSGLPRRGVAPYAERAEERETSLDRFLLAAGAGLKRPLSGALRRAGIVADLTEREQAWADGLTDEKLQIAAGDLRPALVRGGFLPEAVARAFALVRSAAARTVGLRHFSVQLIGGSAMLEGKLVEMGTGEGKTLTATLPAATAALAGMPVHVVTVNDYLARRDAEWMRPVYTALGLTTGIVQHGQQPAERRAAYASDITYCTNKDLGFDYLRDRLALASRRGRGRLLLDRLFGRADRLDRLLLRGLHFALVDEADSVLIDEARTPLIIAGAEDAGKDEALYRAALQIADDLEKDVDYRLDPHERSAVLTDQGRVRLKELSEPLPQAWRSARGREELAQQSLAARHLYELDTHYLVRDGKVQIIDEYTGRVLADRSWERGLQQLIEVKENCEVTGQHQTLARITYQRLFPRYLKLCGMTGTAIEVAPEMEAIYGLESVRIAPNRPVNRSDAGVRVYRKAEQRWHAVAAAAAQISRAGRPVLVGTRSVAASEELASLLVREGVEHVVLNARQDQDEADIVARAGEAGRITVATNMAGRGTDIALSREVAERGGLHVILTEFHESRRIDRQLFGRCGRQGDPGSHEAIVSLEDDVFVRHAGRVAKMLAARYTDRSDPLPARLAAVLRAVAQQSAEWSNAHLRRVTLEQDRKLDSALAFAGRVQ